MCLESRRQTSSETKTKLKGQETQTQLRLKSRTGTTKDIRPKKYIKVPEISIFCDCFALSTFMFVIGFCKYLTYKKY